MGRKKDDPLDGAQFPGAGKDARPEDFYAREDGMRPHNNSRPYGQILVDLTSGLMGRTLPPRVIWRAGEWSVDKGYEDCWVTSGEGTPGNYKRRLFRLPHEQTQKVIPKHPADWPKHLRESSSSGSYYSGGPSSSSKSYSSGLPWELRVACPGCGHFFKNSELPDHAKYACPSQQDKPVLWAMQCACHTVITPTVLPGFPIKPPQAEDTPDTSGDEKEGKEETNEAVATSG